MGTDRALERTIDQVARIQREIDDLRATFVARQPIRPIGDIEASLRTTPKAGTLLCRGQLLL
ncbi:hypothetical protein G3V86_24515, partial [Escherichia coli]|nr:hypothetical protein [Escherichia coli]